MLSKFRRITSTGKFIPEIDGLRFIAIFSVTFFHVYVDILKKTFQVYADTKHDYPILHHIIVNGDRGVPLFFSISGFILALPFANHYINGAKKPRLKDYFLRRLTRLEPPYIVSLVALFFISILIVKKITFSQLLPSLFASLFYINNIFSWTHSFTYVNNVTWSLEIEVQFYILAPFFAMVFSKSPLTRRLIILGSLLFFPFLQIFIQLPFKSLFDYMQYFAVGFLLADLYASKVKINLPNIVAVILGFIFFANFWIYPDKQMSFFYQRSWQFIFPLLILGFYTIVLFTPTWKKIVSVNIFTIIGGMCYSIYLVHFAIISIVNKILVQHKFTNYFIGDLMIQFVVNSIAILIICSIFFLLIEKPCMDKNWPQKLWNKLRGRSSTEELTVKQTTFLADKD